MRSCDWVPFVISCLYPAAMTMKLTLVTLVLAAAGVVLSVEPIEIPAAGGRVLLPLSGLAVNFPARSDARREVKGSWSNQASFDARDVIDEFKDDKIDSGTWVQTGYFDAGDARATVLSSQLIDAWPVTTLEAWGLSWQVRGGKYDLTGSLGVQPALVLAAERAKDYPTLLLYHFFIGETDVSGDEMTRRVMDSPLVAAIVKAYRENRYGLSLPTHNPAVRARNDSVAARTITLVINDLQVALPDDGFIWVPENKPKGNADLIYRLGPTFPELTLDVLVVDASTVEAAWKSLGLAAPPTGTTITNLPDGWVVGPEVTPSSGKESTVAKAIDGRVLIVGLIAPTITSDVDPLAPVLEALAVAVVAKAAGK